MDQTGEVPPDIGNFYFDVSQQRGTERGDSDIGSSGFTNTEALVGLDRVVGPNLSLGGFFDYGETNAGLGSPGSSTDIKDYTLGARANWTQGPWFVDAVVDIGFDNYSSSRPVVFPGTSAAAASNTHGEEWTAAISAGQHFTQGAMTLSPFAGLLETGWRAAGFTESGAGAFDDTVADQSAHSLQSQVGLEGQFDWKVASAMLHPHLSAAWLHEFSDGPRAIDSSFGGVAFSVVTQGPQRNSALLSAGLDAELGPRARLFSNISVQTNGVTRVLSEISAGVSFRF
jgi:outer membrane autotransporter protein